ncbi:MFS general substrate transporter [Mycena chlorophos]|uniref:MFS general substrate transporter n=1 Tax=Mycena chlorophos TaxID=658473 RepID=A0A8H6THL9_MYCCL|nr:MFS general substrate transporter [Mycena chlorophos]
MASEDDVVAIPSDTHQKEPHSIFKAREKWAIVSLVSFGMLFSPLSANIYFPAIPTLDVAFNKSTELINLTVTLFMVFQGICSTCGWLNYQIWCRSCWQMFWGPLADTFGRRFMFISCLVVLALSCVGLALIPTSAYWLLLLLRCLQAFGSASTISLGAGVVGDISTRAERGGFFGVSTLGSLALGPSLGPVLGAVLADELGWRAIFWFLCIGSAFCALVLILQVFIPFARPIFSWLDKCRFLPETLRAIVGDGSISGAHPFLHSPLIPVFGNRQPSRRPASAKESSLTEKPRVPATKFRNPLKLLLIPEILLALLAGGVAYALACVVLTAISTLFKADYHFLTETTLGLCFLSWGFGSLFSTVATGKMLDWDYQRTRRRHHGSQDDFPIEKARLHLVPCFTVAFVSCCIGYGWCMDRRTNIGGPLVFLFIISYLSTAIMNSLQTLMLDLMPTQASSVIACNNLVRCGLGAVLVSVIEPMFDALGLGLAHVLVGGLCLLITMPAVWVLIRRGPRLRVRATKA